MNSAPILYLEDDENDAFLLRRAFQQAEITNPLVIISDGSEALEYLAGRGASDNRAGSPAGLVLLDLNMPGKSGFEVLRWMRSDPCCLSVPVVVLTSSNEEGDIARAYAEHANGFLVKPNRPDELLAVVKALRDYWLIYNRAPALSPRTNGMTANA
ncbi:MAG TPA: response regulator [Verrucomicrobiae bacterium]|jgi:CheY-like chemotaxis protein